MGAVRRSLSFSHSVARADNLLDGQPVRSRLSVVPPAQPKARTGPREWWRKEGACRPCSAVCLALWMLAVAVGALLLVIGLFSYLVLPSLIESRDEAAGEVWT